MATSNEAANKDEKILACNTFDFLRLSLTLKHQNLLNCPNFSTASINPIMVPEKVAIGKIIVKKIDFKN